MGIESKGNKTLQRSLVLVIILQLLVSSVVLSNQSTHIKTLQDSVMKLQGDVTSLSTKNAQLGKDLQDAVNKAEELNKTIQEKDKELEQLKQERASMTSPLVASAVSRGEGPAGTKKYVGVWKISFYSPSADETDSDPFTTASGKRLQPHYTIAVDNKFWRLGTKFYIEGFGIVEAQDTGGAIKGPDIADMAVSTKAEALKLGVQHKKVWVIQ